MMRAPFGSRVVQFWRLIGQGIRSEDHAVGELVKRAGCSVPGVPIGTGRRAHELVAPTLGWLSALPGAHLQQRT